MAKRTDSDRSGKQKKKTTKRRGAPVVRLVLPPRKPSPPPTRTLYQRAFHGELTPEGALLEAALILDLLAKRSAAPLDIDAARLLDALWLARKRADGPTLSLWARVAFKYLDTRQESERWSAASLPPQPGLDRGAAMTTINSEAQRICAANLPSWFVAQLMAQAVGQLFPNLCSNPIDAGKYESAKGKIANGYETLLSEARSRGVAIDSERLVRAALGAFGVKATDVWNWLKGIPIAVIAGTPATASAATAPPMPPEAPDAKCEDESSDL
jgi:hypothetical protein